MRLIFSQRGLASEIARHLKVSPQNVAAWNKVPVHHVRAIAPLIGKRPDQIRPDIFGEVKRGRGR
jgi:hypothetical protein